MSRNGLAATCLVLACGLAGPAHGGEDAVVLFEESSVDVVRDIREDPDEGGGAELHFADGTTVTSCQGYVRAQKRSRLAIGTNNSILRGGYRGCDLWWLSRGKALKLGEPRMAYGRALAHHLHLLSFGTSFGPMMKVEPARTLTELFSDANLTITQRRAKVERKNILFSLEVVAVAQLDDDPEMEWIVYSNDRLKQGTLRDYSTLVVFDPKQDENFDATSAADLLSQSADAADGQ